MGDIRTSADATFRDYVVDGVPSSGENEPLKSAVRDTFGVVEDRFAVADADMEQLRLGQVTGAVVFGTKAALDAALAYDAHTKAEVYADPTEANNGVYEKSGASGAGSWSKVSDLAITAQAARIDALDTAVAGAVESAPLVEYSAIASPYPMTVTLRNERDADFSGWGTAWAKPSSISFNAVALLDIPRGDVADVARWRRVKVYVLTHATDAAGGDGTLVAEGEALVSPEANPISGQLVVLFEPGTATPKTVTEADLLADFFVGYQVFAAETGTVKAVAGEARGTREGGLSLRATYYTTTQDGATEAWGGGSAGELAFDLVMLSGLSVSPAVRATEAFALRQGLPTADMTGPGPNQPILTPRLFALQGYDAVLYFGGLCSGLGPKLYEVAGGVGLGEQWPDRWTYPAPQGITAEGDPLTVQVLDPDYLTVRGQGHIALYMPAAAAAAGATSTGLCIGDSTTNAGLYTQRVLDLAAANLSGVQPTLIGTRGAGANKHEGRGGWTMDAYYETYQRTDGGVTLTNPFVGGEGQKFNAANYLSDTGQATPDWVFWHLGINDVFNAASDLQVQLTMTAFLDKLDRLIGRTADASVGSWWEVDPNIVQLIATPIPPAASQRGFGDDYKIGQSYHRYKRNIAIAAHRIAEHYRDAESEGIYLVPFHLAVDPVAGFDGDSDPIHPNTTGYAQMGNQLYYALNALTAAGAL